jgi:hypothetical protein
MKTVLTATALTLTLGLSSFAHAAFKDKSPVTDTRPATSPTRQDLSHLPTVSNFNQKSHHAKMATSVSSTTLDAGCKVQINFKDSSSGPSC